MMPRFPKMLGSRGESDKGFIKAKRKIKKHKNDAHFLKYDTIKCKQNKNYSKTGYKTAKIAMKRGFAKGVQHAQLPIFAGHKTRGYTG